MMRAIEAPADRHEIVRRVAAQVRDGRYRPPAEAVAEQVIAWLLELPEAPRAEVA